MCVSRGPFVEVEKKVGSKSAWPLIVCAGVDSQLALTAYFTHYYI